MASAAGLAHNVAEAPINVARRVSAEARHTLSAFSDPALLAAGAVNLIALDPIRERMARRWDARREHVYGHVDQTLMELLGETQHHLRISEVDYLICQPGVDPAAAQLACVRALRTILAFFLGQDAIPPLQVHRVLSLSQEGVIAEAVDETVVLQKATRSDPPGLATNVSGHGAEGAGVQGPPEALQTLAPGKGRLVRSTWRSLSTRAGREWRGSCRFETVLELKKGEAIGLRLSPELVDAEAGAEFPLKDFADLPLSQQVHLRTESLAAALDDLPESSQPAIVLPVSAKHMGRIEHRAALERVLRSAQRCAKTGVICELVDLDGMREDALAPAAAFLRPWSILLIGRLDVGLRTQCAALVRAGLHGVVIEAPAGLSDAEFAQWAAPRLTLARKSVKSVMIGSVGSPGRARLLAALGASHASVDVS